MKKQVVLITGCSSGVGKAICKQLKAEDYFVVASARNINSIRNIDVDMTVEIDVTKEDTISTAITKIMDQYGAIDILINNAGYSIRSAIEEIQISEVGQLFNVNVYGIIRMIQTVAPVMRAQGEGKIINVGSVSGKLTTGINGGYCASKHAVEAISEAARYELKPYGIQVTVLEPGAMDTDFFMTLSKNSDERMNNIASPYFSLYQRDINYRKRQKRANIKKSVASVCKIIRKKNLRTRYTISLSMMFKILIRLPDRIREHLVMRFS
jgi:NADP-dependent 3-hydroxy acid dehydrogenase YdfG